MSLIKDLLERPFDKAITSKYTAMNGTGSNQDRRDRVTCLDDVQCPPCTPIRTFNAVPWKGSIGSMPLKKSIESEELA